MGVSVALCAGVLDGCCAGTAKRLFGSGAATASGCGFTRGGTIGWGACCVAKPFSVSGAARLGAFSLAAHAVGSGGGGDCKSDADFTSVALG